MALGVLYFKTKLKRSSTEVSGPEANTHNISSAEEIIEVDINEAYISNVQIPTESNVAYGTTGGPAQAGKSIMLHEYDYVVL